jgi:uncharacterized protein (TIGR03437 family)
MLNRLSPVMMLIACLPAQFWGQTGASYPPYWPCNDFDADDQGKRFSPWTPDCPGDESDEPTVIVTAVLNSASLTALPAAPESWITLTGSNLADTSISASTLNLPVQLGTTQVAIRDSTGRVQLASLRNVSPKHIEFLMPAAVAMGNTTVTVTNSHGRSRAVPFPVELISPGVFTANSTGSGVPAAQGILLHSNGARTPVPVFECSTLPGSCKPVPLHSRGDRDQLVLSLYATGIRGNTDPAKVQVKIDGVLAKVLYAGRQSQYVGLDQVDVEVPNSTAGSGTVNLVLTVGGKSANTVQIELQ